MRHVIVGVECDNCPAQVQGGGAPLAVLRYILAQLGWQTDEATDTDLCPRCYARLRAAQWGRLA